MFHVRFGQSLQNVENRLHERCIDVGHKTFGFGGTGSGRCLRLRFGKCVPQNCGHITTGGGTLDMRRVDSNLANGFAGMANARGLPSAFTPRPASSAPQSIGRYRPVASLGSIARDGVLSGYNHDQFLSIQLTNSTNPTAQRPTSPASSPSTACVSP